MSRIRNTAAATAIAAAIIAAAGGTGHSDPGPLPVRPVASPAEDQAAMQAFATQFGIATAVGGFAGTGIGAVIGCAAGGILTAPTLVFVPAGCIAGAVPGAAVGGIVGTIAVGGPTLVVTGVELIQALAAAPGTTKWAPAA